MKRSKLLLFILCIFIFLRLAAQGNQHSFGQNRKPSVLNNYKSLSKGNIEIIYDSSSSSLAKKSLQMAHEELSRLENILKYKIGSKSKLLLFNSLYNLQHSYASLEDPEYNNNLLYKLPKEFESIYYTGEDAFLRRQVSKALCRLMIKEILYGISLSEKIQRLRGQEIPEWFYQGLPAFMSNSWNSDLEAQLREAFRKGTFKNTNTLSPSETELLGHSLWRYMVMKYGSETLSTLLFITRYSSRLDDAIYFHTKKRTNQILNDWRKNMLLQFKDEAKMDLPLGKANISRKIERNNHASFALNSDGEKAAITTYDKGKFAIWIFDIKNQSSSKILDGGLKVNNQIPNPNFPVVKWKSKDILSLLLEKKDAFVIQNINSKGKVISTIKIAPFKQVKDFTYVNGELYILGGINPRLELFQEMEGQWKQCTNDSNFKHSLFTFNDTVAYFSKSKGVNYWVIGYDKSQKTAFVSDKGEIKSPIVYPDNSLGFLWDITGLFNAYHFNQNGSHNIITNYKTGIIDQQTESNILAEMIVFKGSHAIYTSEVDVKPLQTYKRPTFCSWISQNNSIDSILSLGKTPYKQLIKVNESRDTVGKKTEQFYLHGFDTSYKIRPGKTFFSINNTFTLQKKAFLNRFNYKYVAMHIDNSALGNYLHSFPLVPRKSMRNDLVSIHAHTVLSDILNKTKLAAGIRLNTLLTNTDYWFKFRFRKYRFGHGFDFYRRSRKYERQINAITQNISAIGSYIVDYSFDPRFRSELSIGGRNELIVNKLSGPDTKDVPSLSQHYFTFKPGLIIDNTVAKYPNYNQGIKLRLDINNLWNKDQAISYLQLDFRSYQWLFKKVQIANRVSGAYNLGSTKTVFLVGGMENIIGREDMVSSLPGIDKAQFAFQSITGNMRGFTTGARYGSSFLVSNTEIRLPLHMYIYKSYAYNTFIRELQIIGFWDFGTAFTGASPISAGNPFNTINLSTTNYNISVTSKRNPYLNGIGFGLKSKILGYDIRFDYAVGHQFSTWGKPTSYFTLSNNF